MKTITVKRDPRGGKRPGAGRKKKYGEETVTITFRVPKSKEQKIKRIVSNELKNKRKFFC